MVITEPILVKHPVIAFRPMLAGDLQMLQRWLAAPHVAPWWSAAETTRQLEDHYLPRIAGKSDVKVFIIELASEPIGFIQASMSAELGSCGIDLLIGHAELIGKGLGSKIIEMFVATYVYGCCKATVCTADPDRENQRSIRAFEKAGFSQTSHFLENGRHLVLMTKRR